MGNDIGSTIAGGAAVLLTLVFGKPAWSLARRSEREAERADAQARTEKLAVAVAHYLGVPIDPGTAGRITAGKALPSPERASVIDLLTEIRDFQREQALLSTIIAHHIDDRHGPELPEWLYESANRRRFSNGE